MMEVTLRYHARYEYEYAARQSHNVLRVRPCEDERQQVLDCSLEIFPAADVFSYVDYWGTPVDSFGVHSPHEQLDLRAVARVRTHPQRPMVDSPILGDLDDAAFRDDYWEYLQPSLHVAWGERVAKLCDALPSDDDVVGRVLSVHRRVAREIAFVPGSTPIGTEVEAALAKGRGACQDIAHAMIAILRSSGIPARYVSGYFVPNEATDGDAEFEGINVQTHAWVEAAIPGRGWWGLDPTHRMEVGERHVAIGRGRDYGDVPTLRGNYRAGGAAETDVGVHLSATRAADQ